MESVAEINNRCRAWRRGYESSLMPMLQQAKVKDKRTIASQNVIQKQYGGSIWDRDAVDRIQKELLSQKTFNAFSLRLIQMSEAISEATKIIEDANAVFDEQSSRFNKSSQAAIEQAKKRTSQLSDYNNRLKTAMTKLNETLADDSMQRALENAETLVSAMSALERLEQNGSLERIIAAVGKGASK